MSGSIASALNNHVPADFARFALRPVESCEGTYPAWQSWPIIRTDFSVVIARLAESWYNTWQTLARNEPNYRISCPVSMSSIATCAHFVTEFMTSITSSLSQQSHQHCNQYLKTAAWLSSRNSLKLSSAWRQNHCLLRWSSLLPLLFEGHSFRKARNLPCYWSYRSLEDSYNVGSHPWPAWSTHLPRVSTGILFYPLNLGFARDLSSGYQSSEGELKGKGLIPDSTSIFGCCG